MLITYCDINRIATDRLHDGPISLADLCKEQTRGMREGAKPKGGFL